MAYQSTKPLATDDISVSQGDLQNNFLAVDGAWSVNHVALNLPDEGKHKYITFPNQTWSAGVFPPATVATEVGLYAESGNLYFRPAGQALGVHTNDVKLFGEGSLLASGWCRLPIGLQMAWGEINITSGTVYTFAHTFTAPNLPFSITITPISSGTTKTMCSAYDVTPTGFKATSYNANANFTNVNAYYLAIGI